ncbi:MAG: transporter periplasmic protein [Chloroflexi bacterium]|nr:transporter periplasmic protein [Chloroflexota bacterium]
MKARLWRAVSAAALISCISAGSLAQYSHPTHAAGKTLHVAWFEFGPADVLATLGQQYGRETGTTIAVDRPPLAQWYTSVFNQFAAHHTSFAAAALDSQWLGQAVTDHDVPELTPWLKANLKVTDFYPYLFASYSQYPQRTPGTTGSLDLARGHFYGVPWFADAKMFAYRKDWFSDPANQAAFKAKYHYALGVPKSMDQIVDIADFFTQPSKGIYGYATHEQTGYDAAAETFLPWCWNYGGEIWNSKTGAVQGYVNSPRCAHALQLVDHLTQKDSPPGSGSNFIAEVTNDMNQGKVAMIESWLCCFAGLFDPKASTLGKTKAEIANKIGFFNYPGETYMGTTSRVAPLGGMGLSLSSYASQADQQEILKFVKWFLTPRIQQEWYTMGATPANNVILQSAGFKAAQPWNPLTAQVFSMVKDFWNMPEYSTMLKVMNDGINASMTGQNNAKTTLDTIAKKQAAILGATGRYSAYQ